jgi:hypothetical protein
MDYQRVMKEEMDNLLRKWDPFLEGIGDEYVAENAAMLLENEARYLAEDPQFAAVSAGDVQGLQKIMLPIVRRVFPNLIANNIVSVQPLAAPAGIIFYLKYQYGTDRPGNPVNPVTGQPYDYEGPSGTGGNLGWPPGDGGGVNGQVGSQGSTQNFPEYSMFENDPGMVEGYNPYYSSDETGPFIGMATVASGAVSVASTVVGKYSSKWPVAGASSGSAALSFFGEITEYDADGYKNGTPLASYTFSNVGGNFVVQGVDRLEAASDRYSVAVTSSTDADGATYTTTVTLGTGTNSGLPADDTVVRVRTWYKTDMEFTTNIPEMRITIGSIPVAVKTRKLKAMWSQQSEQDLRAYHGLSADAELTALVSNEMISEIDREVIQKCMSIAPASSRFTHNWADVTYTSGNYLDSHLALMQKVTMASNEVFRKSKIGPANWMIVGTKVASYIETIKGFIPNPVTASMGMSIVKAGNYNGQFDIYKDPMFPNDLILMGHKSPASPFGAGVIYSPYVTNLTPVIVGQDDFNPRRGFLARYGLTQVPFGQYLYSMIKVKGLPN